MRFETRRLDVGPEGSWFLALSVILGAAAVLSANNLLYIIECLLLGGLIVSGLFSEHGISAVDFEKIQGASVAGEVSEDLFVVRNRSRFPVHCVQIGDWKNGRMIHQAYVDRIPGRGTIQVPSEQRFESRGHYDWQAKAISTRFPFGFARKTRIFAKGGVRKVWPERKRDPAGGNDRDPDSSPPSEHRGNLQTIEGEVRLIAPDEDARAIVWTLSTKGEPIGRRTAPASEILRARIDLRQPGGPTFEREICTVAAPFHALRRQRGDRAGRSREAILEVQTHQGLQRYFGTSGVLDFLACAVPSEKTE